MRRPLLAASALAVSLALASALADDDPPPLKFGWPVPSSVRVTEKIEKAGHVATTRCTATLKLEGDGPDLRLHLSDFELVDLDGRAGDDPAIAPQAQLTLLGLRVTPDLVLAPTGEVKDVLGLDAAVTAVIDELAKNADEKMKENIPRLRAQFTSPEAQTAMKENARKAWNLWVAEWVGRVIPAGRGADGTWPLACPDGSRTAAPTRLRRMPGDKEGAGMVRFTRESVLDGEDSRPVLDAWLKQIAAATGKEVPATGLRILDRALTVADPVTLKPIRVLHEEQRILRFEKAPEKVDIERHEYTFEWK